MRIIQIGPYPQSRDCVMGGVEASVYGLAQEQSRTMDVHVFDYPRQEGKRVTERDGNVVVHRFRNDGKWQVSTSSQVKTMVEEICVLDSDVCHIHGTGLFSWLMYRELTRMGLKVVVTVHGLARVEKRNMLKKRISFKRIVQYLYQSRVESRFLSRLPYAIVDTEYVQEMVNCYPIRRKPNMHVIPQGINEDFYQISCSETSKTILSVGAIGERKGHVLTMEAFEHVRKNGNECRLLIIGNVANRSYYEQLAKAIEASEYRDDIELNVNVSIDELKHFYEVSHIFALHTEEESQGVVFAEAMATGMPVVSTMVGGVPYVVRDGVSGMLSQYSDVESFAKNIALFLNDGELWRKASESAKSISRIYHWSAINEKIVGLYRTMLN